MFRWRKRSQEDFTEEIRSHLAMEADELHEEGIPADEASYAARRAFGNETLVQERFYERGRWLWWDHLRQDLRYAVRTLYGVPGFALAAIATLALGIGANVAIFSVVRVVLLKPLPYGSPERIVIVEPSDKNTGRTGTVSSAPDFHDWRMQNRVLEYLAYHYGGEVTAIVDGTASFVNAQAVTPDFFALFGLPPQAGRFWSEDEDRTPLVVLSHRWAQEHFEDVRAAIGTSFTVHGTTVEVIGVAAPGFRYPGTSDIWVPAGLFSENPHRSGHNYFAIGKLKPGVSLVTAQREMRAIGDRLGREHKDNEFKTVAVTPLADRLAQHAETTLWVLLGAVVAVLLISCANVANLQLARAALRSREMAVRAALGAGRGRILRQVLTESLVLGGLGALGGIAVAAILLGALLAIAPSDIPRLDEVRVDGPVMVFALALAGICSILFGLAPARRSSDPDLNAGLRQTSVRGSHGPISGRTRSVLIVAEVALSVVLLAGAGLLIRSFVALTHVDLGFSTDRLLLTTTSIPVADEREARRATEIQRDLLARIGDLPGVGRTAGVRTPPFKRERSTATYWVEGGPVYRPGEEPSAQMQVITPGYFETMGLAMLHGRDFTDRDSWGGPQVAIVNETLARDAFGNENPLGRRIRSGMSAQSMNGMEIIAVVTDARQIAPGEPTRPEVFMPYLQHPFPGSNLTLIAQTQLEPQALSSAIRRSVTNMNPELPVRFSTMDEIVQESLAYPRFRAVLIGCFSVLAACLAVVGIYSVIAYLVSQRTSELGLRFALGARPVDVFRLVVSGSIRLVAWGLALGLIGTLALTRILRTLLFGVAPNDPITLTFVLLCLAGAALLGSSIPALRAARMDPLLALRQE